MKSLARLILIFITSAAVAQPRLVKDINVLPTAFSDNSGHITAAGDFAYFTRNYPNTGKTAVWVTNGTPAGTHVVEGSESSFFRSMSNGTSDGTIYYTHAHPDYTRLYKYNAHTSTTLMLHEFDEGISENGMGQFLTSGSLTIFAWVVGGSNNVEFWKTDGTVPGTVKFKTITGQYWPLMSGWSLATDDASRNYFTFRASIHDEEVWVSDGTDAGTLLLQSFSSNSNVTSFAVVGDVLYFGSFDSGVANVGSLWQSDGTLAGTIKVKDVPGYIAPTTIQMVNGKMLFSDGIDLYESDGTESGTDVLLSQQNVSRAVVLNDTYYGYAMESNPQAARLMMSDGTAVGTTLVAELGSPEYFNSNIGVVNGKMLITGQQSDMGTELAVSDGTTAGTSVLKDIFPGVASSTPTLFVQLSNRVILLANDGVHGEELWTTDGTAAGTQLLIDAPGTKNSTGLYDIQPFGTTHGKLAFSAGETNPFRKEDLWITDGSEGNTIKVYDGGEFDNFNYLGKLNDDVYYETTTKIIKVSGQTMQATVVKDYDSPTMTGFSAHSTNPATIGNKIIYYSWLSNTTGSVGLEPYVSDGTEAGTMLLKDINPGSEGSIWYGWGTVLNDKFIFSARSAAYGEEVWVTDGTTPGTFMLKDINSGTAESYPEKYIVFNNKVFFVANDGISKKLYSTDGTVGNTQLAADIFSDAVVQDIKVVGNSLYFLVAHNANGWQLWKSDGTAANTVPLKTLHSSLDPYDQSASIEVIGDKVYMIVNDNRHGKELWVSDGTVAGTWLVKEVPVGEEYLQGLWGFNGVAYFGYNDDLWKTNGTPEVTEKVTTLWGGRQFTKVNNEIFYFNQTSEYGVELFALPLTGFHQVVQIEAIPTKKLGDSPFNVTATTNSGLLLNFTSSNHVSLSGNAVTILKAGKATITAHQAGNGDFEPGEVSRQFCISPPKPTITTTALPSGVPQLHSSATEGTTWYLDGSTVADGKDFTVTSAGNYTSVVTIEGCVSEPSDVTSVSQLAQSISFNQSDVDFGDATIPLNGTADSGLSLIYTSTSDRISIAAGIATILQAGPVTINASQAGNDLYLPAEEKSVTFCINPPTPAITKTADQGSSAVLVSSSSIGNQWYRDDLPIPGGTLQTLNASESGVYSVMIDIEGCKSLPSENIILIITGIETAVPVSVYPNPASSRLFIRLENAEQAVMATIFNATGQEMVNTTFRGDVAIDVNTFSRGIYVLKLSMDDRTIITRFARE